MPSEAMIAQREKEAEMRRAAQRFPTPCCRHFAQSGEVLSGICKEIRETLATVKQPALFETEEERREREAENRVLVPLLTELHKYCRKRLDDRRRYARDYLGG